MFPFSSHSQKESRYAAKMAAAGGIGLWEWRASSGQFWFSDHASKLAPLKSAPPILVEVQRRLHPDDQSKFLDVFTEGQPGAAFDIVVRFQMRPEQFRWLRWRGKYPEDGMEGQLLGTVQDVHDERLTQLELEFTQEMLREAQRIARLGSWQYDLISNHMFWNEETLRIFGRDPSLGPPQGTTLRRYFDAEDMDRYFKDADAAMRVGHPYQVDIRAIRDDGHYVMVQITARPLFDQSGNLYLIVGTVQDITDWVDLRTKQSQIEENQRTQSQFLANVSHEIRTPMNAIFGMTQLLLRAPLPPQQIEQARVVLSAARDLLTLINDLLDLAKVEAGHMTLEVLPFDLPEMVREITGLHGGKIYGNDLEFIVDLDPLLPRMVEGDALRLKQIIGNLLSNAAKFTKQGQITLKITAEGYAGPQTIVRFAVIDTGVGIPPNRLSAVFQKYEQADTTIVREYGGTGLGLSICRELVRLMGSDIHVTSDGVHGSRFWFDVPLYPLPSEKDAPIQARILVLEPQTASGENLRLQGQTLGAQMTLIGHADNLLPALNAAAPEGFTHVMIADHASYDANVLAASIRISTSESSLILLSTAAAHTLNADAFDAVTLKPTLPHELRRVVEMGTQRTSLDRPSSPSARPMVLLVEDNRANQDALARLLEQAGCDVKLANHGQEAVGMIKREAFALIFMDLQMPVLDGLTATRELYEFWTSQNKPMVPIVGLTGNIEAENRAACLAAGMVEVLIKPVMLETLNETVVKFIKKT